MSSVTVGLKSSLCAGLPGEVEKDPNKANNNMYLVVYCSFHTFNFFWKGTEGRWVHACLCVVLGCFQRKETLSPPRYKNGCRQTVREPCQVLEVTL